VSDASSQTIVHATLLAKGGENSGKGGQIETSGAYLNIDDIEVSTLATNGSVGEWLLDPGMIEITETTSDYRDYTGYGNRIICEDSICVGHTSDTVTTIRPDTIATALGTSDVTIHANDGIFFQNGTIEYTGNNDRTLTFRADKGSVNMDGAAGAAHIISTTAKLNVDLLLSSTTPDDTASSYFAIADGSSISTNGGYFHIKTGVSGNVARGTKYIYGTIDTGG